MRRMRKPILVAFTASVMVTSLGCVSRDEYLREKFGRRKAQDRVVALERELEDCRDRSLACESDRDSLTHELGQKNAMIETLKAENDRLDAFAAKLQGQLDEFLAKGIGDIEVVEVKLPPEIDKALKELAAMYPDEVEYDPVRGAVRWKSDLTFALGSDQVRDGAKASLKAFADIVRAASGFDVLIVGHTDDVRISPGTAKKHPTNWHLSVHRAVSVLFELNRDGVGFDRMGVMGYGEFRPIVPNPARGGAEANRRVEIYLVSNQTETPGVETTRRYKTPEPVAAGSPQD